MANINTQLVIGKKLSQASTRLAQMRAFQKRMAKIEKYAIYFGTFNLNGFDYFDGSALFNYKKVAQAINAELENLDTPFYINEDMVLGQGFQARPYSCKSFFLAVTIKTIVMAIRNRCGGDGNIVRLHIPTMTQKERQDFIDALNKKQESPYWGKVVVVTMTDEAVGEELDFLADMNSFKAPYHPEKVSYFNVMEISHKPHGDITMSAQLCKSLFVADAKATEELLLNKAQKLIDEKVASINEAESKDAGIVDLLGDMSQLVTCLRPDFVREQSASLYRTQVSNLIEGIERQINNLNLPLEGKYAAVIPELSLLFCDKKFLRFGEVFSPGCEDTEMEAGKYPKAANHEKYSCRGISADEYISRAVGILDRESFEEFKTLVRAISPGLCILPAFKEIMSLLAGLDYDGDKIFLIWEKLVVAILRLIESIVAIID